MLVGFYYDSNCIHAISIKNRKGPTTAAAWKELNNLFKTSDVAPEAHVLDNETSKYLLDAFEEEKIAHQLVTPHEHRSNRA